MMKSPIYKFIGMASWLITALAAINIGFSAFFGSGIFETEFVRMNLSALVVPSYYLIGVAGIVSLIMFFLVIFKVCKYGKTSGSCSCSCCY